MSICGLCSGIEPSSECCNDRGHLDEDGYELSNFVECEKCGGHICVVCGHEEWWQVL
jgi:hypothetical protein